MEISREEVVEAIKKFLEERYMTIQKENGTTYDEKSSGKEVAEYVIIADKDLQPRQSKILVLHVTDPEHPRSDSSSNITRQFMGYTNSFW